MDGSIFFHGFGPLGRTLLVGLISYATLVVLLRLSGKRAISKMNIFDFVVVVAIGSTLANVITTPDLDLADGLAALFVLVAVQHLISWATAHSHRVEKWVNGEPTLLLYRGQCIETVMKAHRVTKQEVRAAVRMAGLSSLDHAHAVVLETDGVFSVIEEGGALCRNVMVDVAGYPRDLETTD
ncbi:MAG TPA: YetF domain-containing protein [Longimicrobium sp.]